MIKLQASGFKLKGRGYRGFWGLRFRCFGFRVPVWGPWDKHCSIWGLYWGPLLATDICSRVSYGSHGSKFLVCVCVINYVKTCFKYT